VLFGVTFGLDHNLYVAVATRDQVLRYNGSTGAFIDAFASISPVGSRASPVGLTFGPDSNLYVSTANTNQVVKIDGATGHVLATFSSPFLSRGAGIAFGPDGFLYVASQFTDEVVRFDPRDGSSDVFTHGASVRAPNGVAFGPDGNLYVTSALGGGVLRYNSQTGEFIDNFVSLGGFEADLAFTTFITPPLLPALPEPSTMAFIAPALAVAWFRAFRRPTMT